MGNHHHTDIGPCIPHHGNRKDMLDDEIIYKFFMVIYNLICISWWIKEKYNEINGNVN